MNRLTRDGTVKTVSHFVQKQIHAVQCLNQLGAAMWPLRPLPAARAGKAGEGGSSNEKAVPHKVRVGLDIEEGS